MAQKEEAIALDDCSQLLYALTLSVFALVIHKRLIPARFILLFMAPINCLPIYREMNVTDLATLTSPPALYSQTHLLWKVEENCTSCPLADNVCVRPLVYGMPVLCVHVDYGTNFHQILQHPRPPTTTNDLLLVITTLVVAMFLMKVKSQ
jgi:hypothetical protein